ncbi:MAG: GNAT family N-acetyltransferase [Lachnospiraceae bacterium]|nr:GNAT family N-acetyltransferase [Lachnospiraceae bacterium]
MKYFAGLDPFLLLERTKFPGVYAIGVLDTDEDEDEDTPVGLAICTASGTDFIIEWFFIAKEMRGNGVGKKLLNHIFAMAEECELENVCAYFTADYDRYDIFSDAEGFFRSHSFDIEIELGGEWYTDVRMLLKDEKMKQNREDPVAVIPLSRQVSYKTREILNGISVTRMGQTFFNKKGLPGSYDPKLSFIVMEKHEITGALLVKLVDDVLYPTCIFAECEDDLRSMLNAMVDAARKNDMLGTELHLIMRLDEIDAMVEEVMPGRRIENKVLVADIDSYQSFDYDSSDDKDNDEDEDF